MTMLTWQVTGSSVQGASHIRQGLPNQDAWQSFTPNSQRLPIILAVADGHGSAKCFRSQRGARLAVEQALNVMQDFIASTPSLADVRWLAEEKLSKTLVQQWRQAVVNDVAQQPFLPHEQALLPSNKEPYLAYGSTLLVAVVTDVFVLLMQLGDGDILQVLATGAVQRPMVADPRLLGNETTSLCGKDAWRQFRCCVQNTASEAPVLWLLATDGYANSFAHAASFEQVGTDLLSLIEQASFDVVAQHLPDWLQAASQEGSGDDVTVGLIYAYAKPIPYKVSKQRLEKATPAKKSLQWRKEQLSKRTRRNLVELSQLLSGWSKHD